jgi:hypothetical protein
MAVLILVFLEYRDQCHVTSLYHMILVIASLIVLVLVLLNTRSNLYYYYILVAVKNDVVTYVM